MKVVIELPVVLLKVYVELCLEQQHIGVYVVKSKVSRVEFPVNDQAENAPNFHLLKLPIRVSIV